MLTLTSNEQAEELIKNGVLAVEDDIEIAFDGFSIATDIKCHNIYSKDYRRDINCRDINCWDINCWDINCRDINCRDINYYAVAFAHDSFKCKSVKGRRKNSKHFCLDQEIEYIKDSPETIEIAGHKYNKSEVEERLKDLKEIN